MSNTPRSLEGKRVVVIGGTSGVGYAIAEAALQQGASVTVASSNVQHVDAAVAQLRGVSGAVVNLRDESSVSTLFEQLGAFDHLAITAGDWGGWMFAPARDIDLDFVRDGLEVRFWGAIAAIKHASRRIAPTGSITLTSGMLAHRPMKGAPLATAIGGAVEHLARGLAIDIAPVRVNAVCLGLILTEQVKQMPQERLRGYVDRLPVPRAAAPAEAASAYLYLMTNDYATGQVVRVDGGGSLV